MTTVTTITATPTSAQSRFRLSRADIPVAALGGLLLAAIATGQTAPTTAGIALCALSLLVTVVVLAFARRQLRADPRSGSFARLAIGLAISTIALGLADNVLLLAAAWIASGRMMVGLIGHVGDWREAREAARRAHIAFTIGDLAVVAAVTFLSLTAGSTALGTIEAALPGVSEPMTSFAALLLVIAAVARCAVPPFSNWLMRSLAAPTPVSALMHAGFVNAGGFLLIQLGPVLEAAPFARYALFACGLTGALWGSAVMLIRADVKGALAASTVSQMGFMLLTIALGAYPAALWHMVAHGLFKAWLFLGSAGTISTAPARAKGLPQPYPALIALATLIGGIFLVEAGEGNALLPVCLAMTALLSALAMALRSLPRGRFGFAVVLAPIALIALNALALAVMTALQPEAAHPLFSPFAQLAILSLLLAGWVTQQRVMSGEQMLPPTLFARLIHADNAIATATPAKD